MIAYFTFILACVVGVFSLLGYLICIHEERKWEYSGMKGLAEALGKKKSFYTNHYRLSLLVSICYVVAYLTY